MAVETTWSHEDVQRGRELVARENGARWELGDLALKVAPVGTHGGKHDGETEAALNRFAVEIGIGYEALDSYRQVAAKWPKSTRVDLPWSVHRAFASLKNDRERVIRSHKWTAREAREFLHGNKALDDWSHDADSLSEKLGSCCPTCMQEIV